MKPVAALLLVVATLLATSCSAPPAAPIPKGAATVRFDISSDPLSLDPLFIHPDSGGVEAELARLVFEPFVDIDASGHAVPVLIDRLPTVANGGISRDGRTYTYHLRRGVRWSDGVPVTSADVLFTLRAILNPYNAVATRNGYDRIVHASAIGNDVVVFKLAKPWAPAALTFFVNGSQPQFVLPSHVLASQDSLAESPFNGAPTVGDGPFRFVEWRRGDGLEYAANRTYWRGRPHVDDLDIHIVPDPNTNLALMQAGDIDFNLLAPVQIATLAKRPHVAFRRVASALVAGIALNLRSPPLDERDVRRAIAMSIDREAISRLVTLGRYPVAGSDKTSTSFAFDPRVHGLKYDPDGADRLLEAGHWRRGMGGIRGKNGHLLTVEYVLFPESTTGQRVAVFVEQELEDRGFLVSIKNISNDQLFLPETGYLARGEFSLAYVPWTLGVDPDDDFIYGCDGTNQNWMRFCDPRVRRLESDAVSTNVGFTRRAIYSRIDRIVEDETPVVWLFRADYTYAYRTRLANFEPNAFGPTWNAYAWTLR